MQELAINPKIENLKFSRIDFIDNMQTSGRWLNRWIFVLKVPYFSLKS